MLTETNFFAQEKVKSARHFAELIGAIYGEEKLHEFLGTYCYLRNLDNLNDNGGGNAEVKSQLEAEINKLHGLNGTGGSSSFFGRLSDLYGHGILEYFIASVEGFLIDNEMMRNRAPLSCSELKERNKKAFLPGFQITSLILFGRELESGEEFERMGDTYLRYDALVDIAEDFPHHLYLFPREELSQFSAHGVLKVRPFYESCKRNALRAILGNSMGIFHTNTPLWFKTAFSAYFSSRYFKLANHEVDYKPEVYISL